ncbi:MAG: hypothetical protein ACYDAL_09410 [Candidatus Dormibacteraceae bacterium]
MSKRITTRWYIGSWIVYMLAVIALFVIAHNFQGSSSPPRALFVPYVVMAVTGVVMLVTWIGALVKLGQQQAWGWFVALLLLHLVGLGIIGMVAYSVSGPEDPAYVVIRPSTPV